MVWLSLNFKINEEIDNEKVDIIKSNSNKILVTAPPGTGKTFTAILKAKQLIAGNKIKGEQKILLLTFTNNAIKQINQTKQQFLSNDETRKVEVKTYYSFYLDLVSKFGRYIELPIDFTIMNSHIFKYYYNEFIEKFNLNSSSH